MSDDISNPLLALIREQGLVDDLQYEEVVAEIKRSGTGSFQILQDFGILDADAILQAMANHLGAEVVSIKGAEIPKAALAAVPGNTAKMYRCIPVSLEGNTLRVAFEDPLDPAKVDELGFVAKKDIQLVLANPSDISAALDKFYGEETSEDVSKLLEELGGDEKIAEESMVAAETDDEDLVAGLANEAPIVRFVNLVLLQAVKDRASDIHFEPFETEFRIRYRVDGALYEMSPPPKHLALPVISRIKVMSNLNISERRIPQDGRINYNLGKKTIDLDLENLGLPKNIIEYIYEAIQQPNGIFIVTGPTGSGKTTTLYSCLRKV